MYVLKEMPLDQRPRERLITLGVKALLDEELMAILLRTGNQNQSVLELSKKVLYHLDTLNALETMTYQELSSISGIKSAKACTIIAAIELGRRLAIKPLVAKLTIKEPKDVYHYLIHELKTLEQEHFICLYMNVKSQVIAKETIFIGTISQMIIHPREIFKHAIKYMASGVIFIHNHPTGETTPSMADVKATHQLKEAGLLLGIEMIDHIIIGNHEFYSFKEKNKTYL
jgi:DNA repair protein RadC